MPDEIDAADVAVAVHTAVSLMLRRMRHERVGGLTIPESAALSRLERGGPATSAELARQEQISPQSMGSTLAGLEQRGLVERSPDAGDRRRVVLAISASGRDAVHNKRSARAEQLSQALASGFSQAELHALLAAAPLLERLAENIRTLEP